MKIHTSKNVLVLFLLFFGLANTQAATNDCLLDVFHAELKEKNSKELDDYFSDKLNKSKEDLNKAFEAWKVLYQADKNVDRLHIDNIETVLSFMVSTGKTVEEMVENIKLVNGFEIWKNLDYQFQKEGYVYNPQKWDDGGDTFISHSFQKEGKVPVTFGTSTITPDGVLVNSFNQIPKDLRRKGISKAMYHNVLKEDIKSISISIYKANPDNFSTFMEEFKKTNDKVKAFMKTPAGKVLSEEGWVPEPTDIKVTDNEISVNITKQEGSAPIDPWINKLPTELKSDLFKDGKLYDLFKNADAAQREKLIKSWEALKGHETFRKMPQHLKIIAKLGEKFSFQEERGYKALELVLSKMTEPYQSKNLVESIEGLDNIFYKINDLPISISFKKRESDNYILVIIDGAGDEVIEGLRDFAILKSFNHADHSYEKVGEYKEFEDDVYSIFRKGNEIGVRSNVVNLDTNLKYQFQREGYAYKPDEVTLPSGVKRIHHYIQKGEESISCGRSRISPNGIVSNELNIPEHLREKGISKAIYGHVLKNDIKSFSSSYVKGNPPFDPVNYNAFMKAFAETNDKVKAALATPEGKVIGIEFEPLIVEIYDDYISVTWGRRGLSKVNVEPWVNSLPADLRKDLFEYKDEFYRLFRDANEDYRKMLIKNWEALKNSALRTDPDILVRVSKVSNKFEFNGEQGPEALSSLFGSKVGEVINLKQMEMEMEFINRLYELINIFEDPDNLPISFTCVWNSEYYDPVILDGVKDEILIGKNVPLTSLPLPEEIKDQMMIVSYSRIIKKKFFENVDTSYEKIGEYKGSDIYKKGDEIGFKSADIININKVK